MKCVCAMCGKTFKSKKHNMSIEIDDICNDPACQKEYSEAVEESFNQNNQEEFFLTEEDLNEKV